MIYSIFHGLFQMIQLEIRKGIGLTYCLIEKLFLKNDTSLSVCSWPYTGTHSFRTSGYSRVNEWWEIPPVSQHIHKLNALEFPTIHDTSETNPVSLTYYCLNGKMVPRFNLQSNGALDKTHYGAYKEIASSNIFLQIIL